MSILIGHIDAVSDEFLKVFESVSHDASGRIDAHAFYKLRRLLTGANVRCFVRAKRQRSQRYPLLSQQIKERDSIHRATFADVNRPSARELHLRGALWRSRVTELSMDGLKGSDPNKVIRLPISEKHQDKLTPKGIWLYRLKRKRLLSLQFSDIDTENRGTICSSQLLEVLGLTNIGQFKIT